VAAVTLRPVESRDVERAGDVNFVAFYRVALEHGLAPAVSSPAESHRYLRHLLGFDPLGGVVAEEDGHVVGVAWVHARGPVATIGPVAVDPRVQGRGIGRRLVERCLEIAGRGVAQVRLVQESHNLRSLGLYLRLGFRVVAPLLELERPAGGALAAPVPPPGTAVRTAVDDDRARIVARDARAFGAPRPQSVELYVRHGRVLVAERGRTLAGYALSIGFEGAAYLGSAAAEDGDVLLTLLATAAADLAEGGFRIRTLVPAGDRVLVEGLLELGFRVFRACQYMVRGGGTAPPPNYVLMNGDMM
jgi:ribosomal protein S18 acetylase RimI-like enzyme